MSITRVPSTTVPTTNSSTSAPSAASLLRDGALATVLAAVATAAVSAIAHASGVSLTVGGKLIPPSGFATMTIVFAALGLLIALTLRRYAAHPRTAWLRITIPLTALSWLPDLLADADPSTKAILMLTHLAAAAIIIPAVARRLRP